MKTRQYFEYKYNGKTRQFLLMTNEVSHIETRIALIGIEKTFEYYTGKVSCSDIVLKVESYGPNNFLYSVYENNGVSK